MSSICHADHGGNWASLPREILILILERLVAEVTDYIHFAAVCKNWLSAVYDHYHSQQVHKKTQFLPELLLPVKTNDDESELHRGFYNAILDRIIFNTPQLRVPCNKRCCGSSLGWLIFTEESLELLLFNPFSGVSIHLPQVVIPPTQEENNAVEDDYFYDHQYAIQKVVLSADPCKSPDNYEALALLDHSTLAFFRCGQSSWIYLKPNHLYEEVAYFDGYFYAASHASLVRFDVICLPRTSAGNAYQDQEIDVSVLPTVLIDYDRAMQGTWVHKAYLVGTPQGKILWVDRCYTFKNVEVIRDDSRRIAGYRENIEGGGGGGPINIIETMDHQFTVNFNVYEVNEDEDDDGNTEAHMRDLDELGDDAVVFLGQNNSEMVSTGDLPAEYKPRGNCIYYMDDSIHIIKEGAYYPFGAVDMGVYDLEDHSCKPLKTISGGQGGQGKGLMPPPIWIVPQINLPPRRFHNSESAQTSSSRDQF
ncbi:hypothetical protein SAY87_005097 [Trapa incisa]|uniref:F-box domain-containing protein n=1 Tax=Trapa incisa TaxID=236973 RepID=A0AAN7JQB4_9MYRT|nr:hypothetical protein SAY87_005097 [Trapa incisa]